jgi:hypothetical protein
MACCKSCAQVAGKGKYKKSRSAGVGKIFKTMKGGKSRSQLIITAAKIGGGFMAGQIIENIGPLKGNKYLSAGAKIVGGIILAGMSKSTQDLAIGLAASGVVDIAQQVTGGAGAATNGIGLLPYGGSGSSMLPGVAGDYSYSPSGGMMVVG